MSDRCIVVQCKVEKIVEEKESISCDLAGLLGIAHISPTVAVCIRPYVCRLFAFTLYFQGHHAFTPQELCHVIYDRIPTHETSQSVTMHG